MSFLTNQMASEITNFISNSKIEKAIDKFIEYAQIHDKDAQNQLILLSGRLSSLKRTENLGLLGFSDTNRERNILNNSILALVEQYSLNEKNQPVIVIQNQNVFNFVISGVNFKDIDQLEAWLNKPALNIESHYTETLTLGKTIYSYLKFKWDDEETTEKYGSTLKWSVKKLDEVKNMNNLQGVKSAVKALLDTIKEFFYDEMESDILGTMYQKVLETSTLADYLFYYEIYYTKVLELSKTDADTKPMLNAFLAAKNDLVTATLRKSEPFVEAKLKAFQKVWGQKH